MHVYCEPPGVCINLCVERATNILCLLYSGQGSTLAVLYQHCIGQAKMGQLTNHTPVLTCNYEQLKLYHVPVFTNSKVTNESCWYELAWNFPGYSPGSYPGASKVSGCCYGHLCLQTAHMYLVYQFVQSSLKYTTVDLNCLTYTYAVHTSMLLSSYYNSRKYGVYA